jgi:GntR family transcriptional regulator
MFDIHPNDSAPIWKQIEEGIRRLIGLGTLQPGESVPSVRDLARDLRVNPNTVARAYQRLTDAGVLAVRRGEGTYVAEEPSQPNRSQRSEVLRDAANRYASAALSVGVQLAEAIDVLEGSYAKLVGEHRRKK